MAKIPSVWIHGNALGSFSIENDVEADYFGLKRKSILDSEFFPILCETVIFLGQTSWRRVGAGASRGLQIRRQLSEGSCGGFDSLTPPPNQCDVNVTSPRASFDPDLPKHDAAARLKYSPF